MDASFHLLIKSSSILKNNIKKVESWSMISYILYMEIVRLELEMVNLRFFVILVFKTNTSNQKTKKLAYY